MRKASLAFLLLLLASLCTADDAGAAAASGAADDEGDDDDLVFDDDDDVEVSEGSGAAAFGAGGDAPPPVEDFDLGLPEEDRKVRMKACFGHTMSRVQARQSELEAGVKEILNVHQDKITQEQALNTMVFSWMMSCYMNIDEDGISKAQGGRALSEDAEQQVFSRRPDRPQQVNQASRRQWQLLESVVMEHQQQRKANPQQGPRPGGLGVDLPGQSMSGQSQAIYILVVFGTFFGGGALIVFRLLRSEQGAGKDRPSKADKKAEKAEKKLQRKNK